MAVWSTVNLSNTSLDRFDAEFFRPDHIVHLEVMKSTGECKSLRTLFKKIQRGSQPRYSSFGKISALRSVNVGLLSFNNTRQEFVTEDFFNSNPRGRVIKDDVLITSTGVGTLGRTSIWPYALNAYCDGHLTILRGSTISPYLIALFLTTTYGLSQIEKNIRGSSGQIEIYPNDIGKIQFPSILVIYQLEIEQKIKEAFELREEAKYSLQKIQQFLDAELGLEKLHFDKPVGYMTKFSELELSRRLDPEHFYPAFSNWASSLPHHIKLVSLASQLSFCQRGQQPEYIDKGLPVINSKHVQPNKIILDGNRKAITNPMTDLQIRYGDTLINGTGRGTIGRAAPYLITDHKSIPDNHVTILRTPSLDPAYLSFFLNSQAGQLQVERHQRGTSGQLELYPFDIRKFLVWAAPESIQKEIRILYEKAAESERRSKELLVQAKTRVEQLIEETVQA